MRALIRSTTAGRTGRRDRESGSTAIEFVIWTPLLMFLILIVVQFALYLFAEHVAATAAQAGARAARQEEAGPGPWQNDAAVAADGWVGNLIGDGASAPEVHAWVAVPAAPNVCTPADVEVTVSFTMNSLLGGMQVSGMSEGPVENFYPDDC